WPAPGLCRRTRFGGPADQGSRPGQGKASRNSPRRARPEKRLMSVEIHSAPVPAPTEKTGGPSIRTVGLVKIYGQRTGVHGVNPRSEAGEIVGLRGKTGAGKPTTFYTVVGLVPATAGRVFINGQDATHLRMHRRARLGVGYLPQEPSIFRKLTVRQNILA